MKLLELSHAIGRLEGVSLKETRAVDGDIQVNFGVESNDWGWWSLELLCSLEEKYGSQIQVRPGPAAGCLDFAIRLPPTAVDALQEELENLLACE